MLPGRTDHISRQYLQGNPSNYSSRLARPSKFLGNKKLQNKSTNWSCKQDQPPSNCWSKFYLFQETSWASLWGENQRMWKALVWFLSVRFPWFQNYFSCAFSYLRYSTVFGYDLDSFSLFFLPTRPFKKITNVARWFARHRICICATWKAALFITIKKNPWQFRINLVLSKQHWQPQLDDVLFSQPRYPGCWILSIQCWSISLYKVLNTRWQRLAKATFVLSSAKMKVSLEAEWQPEATMIEFHAPVWLSIDGRFRKAFFRPDIPWARS